MDSFRIDEIARRLLDSVPPALRTVQKDLEGNFRAVLRASLGKLDLVTREEFDVQARVLERTRARLEQLEVRLQELERGAGPVGGASAGTVTPEAGGAGATGAGVAGARPTGGGATGAGSADAGAPGADRGPEPGPAGSAH